MRLDLTDLKLFLDVHETGTITAGAQRSNITTASASERIKGMEAALDVLLFNRNRRGVTVTPAGRTLLHHARTVLQQMAHLHGDLGQYSSGLKGQIRLLSNTSAINEYVPALLGSFLKAHADLSIDLEECASTDIADRIRRGMADIGLIADSIPLQGLKTHFFRRDPLVIALPHAHPLTHHTSLRLAQVLGEDFVGLADDSALQKHIASHVRQSSGQLHYRVRLRSIDAVCRMVSQGIGLAIIPEATAMRCARQLRLAHRPLADRWATRNLLVCTHASEPLPVYVQSFLQHILTPR